MPLLKTRADFIKALPKKFPNIDKVYKIRDCTKAELVEGYRTGIFSDKFKYKKIKACPVKATNTKTTSTSTVGFDASIFQNNPAFANNFSKHVTTNTSKPSSKSTTKTTTASVPASKPVRQSSKSTSKLDNMSDRNAVRHQTIELEHENGTSEEITPEQLKNITGMDINELNEINRKQQEERMRKKMQQVIIDEMNRLREMEALCTQGLEIAIKIQNYSNEFKKTAKLSEHREYAEVCENLAYVFSNRLSSARTIHMDICIRRDIPVPMVKYKIDDSTANVIRLMNKIKRRYDHMRDDTIDGKYNTNSTETTEDMTGTPSDNTNTKEAKAPTVMESDMANTNEVNYEDYQNNVIVEDITPNLPSNLSNLPTATI